VQTDDNVELYKFPKALFQLLAFPTRLQP